MRPRLRRSLRRLLPARRGCAVRGPVSNVIVIKAPAPCFREALFILRDDYLAEGDRETLLRQAREAAASFTGPASPPPPRPVLWLLAALALLAALLLRFCLLPT